MTRRWALCFLSVTRADIVETAASDINHDPVASPTLDFWSLGWDAVVCDDHHQVARAQRFRVS